MVWGSVRAFTAVRNTRVFLKEIWVVGDVCRLRGQASSQDHYSGKWLHGQGSCWAMGKNKGKQGRNWHGEVVYGRILNGQSKSQSHRCVLQLRRLDWHPEWPQYRTKGGVRCWSLGNRSCTMIVSCNSIGTTNTWSQDGGNLEWFTDSHQIDGAPGAGARAATSKCYQWAC